MRKKMGFILIILIAVGLFIITQFNQDIEYITQIEEDKFQDIIINKDLESSGERYKFNIPENFKKVAENSMLELYLEKESIAIAVRQKNDGYTWYSYDIGLDAKPPKYTDEMLRYVKSGISLVTYNKFTPGRRTVMDSNVEKSYQIQDNGFVVTVDFLVPKIKFNLYVRIQGGDLIVNIPRESVKEYHPDLWTAGNNDVSIKDIIIYPFFGSTSVQENGYIIIPDGSGAIIQLNEKPKYAAGYSAEVYGKDQGYEDTFSPSLRGVSVKPPERVLLPIYGIIHEENKEGVLVIAESGESYAVYNYNSKNLTTDFYQSYFLYNYRTTYKQFQSRVSEEQHVLGFQKKPNDFDLTQRYVFLNGDKANYVGAAKKYRDFLVKKDGFSKKTSKFQQMPMKIDFINNEIELGTFGFQNVAATSYEQAKQIIERLLNKRYKALNITFKTFKKDEQTYGFHIFNHLGGEYYFNQTIQYFYDNNLKFNYYRDYARTYSKRKYTASKMNRQALSVFENNRLLYTYLNNPKYLKSFIKKDLDKLKENNINSLALDGFSGSLFTHRDQEIVGYSNEGMEYIKSSIKFLNENDIKASIYSPDAYLLPYIEDYFNTPIRSSELMFIDKTIPLVSLVVSGYVDMYSPYMNFSSDETSSMLKLIEFGVYPSFVLTGESIYEIKETYSNDIYVSEIEYLEGKIDYYYNNVSKALNKVLHREMINHQIIDKGIVLVEYDNGIKILINHTDSVYIFDGNIVQAKGYLTYDGREKNERKD